MKKSNLFFITLAFTISISSCDLLLPEEDDSIIYINESITTPTTWLAEKTYVVENSISVDGTTLTIEPGTVIKFKAGASISFGWSDNVTLVANGTSDKPIVFTAFASNPAPGSWDGIWFYGNTLTNSSMTYCEVLYAGEGDHPAVNLDEKITMNNCKIKFAKKEGIYSAKGFVSFANNTIQEVGTHAIEIESIGVQTLSENNEISCESNYGIKVRSGSLDGATATWTEQPVAYYVSGGIHVENDFTIQAGTTIKFFADGYFDIGYYENTTITAIGTTEKPITFTSAAPTPAAGAWQGLFFYTNTSANSMLKNCVIEYAGKDNDNANISLYDVTGLTIESCIIRNSAGWGVFSWNSTWNNNDNVFENNVSGNIFWNN